MTEHETNNKFGSNDKLRTALENMGYCACTDEDIAFLESRIAGFRPENPRLFSWGRVPPRVCYNCKEHTKGHVE